MESKSEREPLGVSSRSGDRSLLEREEPFERPEACLGLLLFGEGFLGFTAGRDPEAEETTTPVFGAAGFLNGSKIACRPRTGVEAAAGTKAEVTTTEDESVVDGKPSKERDMDKSGLPP